MDFSGIGGVEAEGAVFCAHAQRRVGGKKCHIRGPYRPDQQAAQEDLESMRAAASGMSREDGCYRRPSVAPGTYPFSFVRKARTIPEEFGLEPLST